MGSSLKGISEAYWLETQPEGYPLGDWIRDQRQKQIPWRHISTELRERTRGVVDLPAQTLINWYDVQAPEAVGA